MSHLQNKENPLKVIYINDGEKCKSKIMDHTRVKTIEKYKEKSKRKVDTLEAPNDKYFITSLLFFFSGLAGSLQLQFFLVATDYWMYKLRDPQYNTYDLDNKTYYQKMFVSITSIAQGFPSMIAAFLSAKFAFRIDARMRFLVTMGSTSVLFAIFTVLVKINTDKWQKEFFITAITVITAISLFHPLFNVTIMALMSKFPSKYIKLNMYGSTVSGVFSACLQIISLSITDSPTDVALIYFTSGTLLMIFTCFLFYIMKYSPVVEFFWNEGQEKHTVPSHTLTDFKNAVIKVWPLVIILTITMGTLGIGHPNLTNLIVSEGYKDDKDNLWYSKYFTPTVTYLGTDIFNLIGRYFGKGNITRKNAHWFISLSIVRSVGLGALFLFCNAQPRSHLPVLFPRDFEYIILLALHQISLAYIMTSYMLSTPSMGEDQAEVSFVLMQVVTSTTMTVTSFLNPIYVKML